MYKNGLRKISAAQNLNSLCTTRRQCETFKTKTKFIASVFCFYGERQKSLIEFIKTGFIDENIKQLKIWIAFTQRDVDAKNLRLNQVYSFSG